MCRLNSIVEFSLHVCMVFAYVNVCMCMCARVRVDETFSLSRAVYRSSTLRV